MRDFWQYLWSPGNHNKLEHRSFTKKKCAWTWVWTQDLLHVKPVCYRSATVTWYIKLWKLGFLNYLKISRWPLFLSEINNSHTYLEITLGQLAFHFFSCVNAGWGNGASTVKMPSLEREDRICSASVPDGRRNSRLYSRKTVFPAVCSSCFACTWNRHVISKKFSNFSYACLPEVYYRQFWPQFHPENIGWHQISISVLFDQILHHFVELMGNPNHVASFCDYLIQFQPKSHW